MEQIKCGSRCTTKKAAIDDNLKIFTNMNELPNNDKGVYKLKWIKLASSNNFRIIKEKEERIIINRYGDILVENL